MSKTEDREESQVYFSGLLHALFSTNGFGTIYEKKCEEYPKIVFFSDLFRCWI